MNLRDLKYLVAVVEHKHFGKAAEACHISQPTLSMQLKKLEDFLGVVLVERTNKSVLITPIGYQIVEQAKKILSLADYVQDLAKTANDPLAGRVRLGIIPTLGPYLLPHIMPLLSSHFPKLELFLTEAQTQVIVADLLEGKLDALLLALPVNHPDIEAAELFEEPFLLAVPQQHPYSTRKTVTYDDLYGQEILLLEEGHCLRDQALEVCQLARITEKADFRATSLETLRHMVAAGRGITLIPKLAAPSETKGIAYIPFSNPVPSRTIGLAWRKMSARKELFAEMRDAIRAETP